MIQNTVEDKTEELFSSKITAVSNIEKSKITDCKFILSPLFKLQLMRKTEKND